MKTMPRLKGFNYRRPFFYMVTLKRRADLSAFSQIAEEANGRKFSSITRASGPPLRGANGPSPAAPEPEPPEC